MKYYEYLGQYSTRIVTRIEMQINAHIDTESSYEIIGNRKQ